MVKSLQILTILTNKLLLACLLCFLFLLTIHGGSKQYKIREFSVDLPQLFVYSIIQDNNGFLWVGTGAGLSRFDGFNFRNFSTSDSLADNFITCSFKNGNDIWFGHMNGQISYFNGKIFKSVDNIDQKSSITAIEKNPDGKIWAATFSNGFIRLDGKEAEFKTFTGDHEIPVYSFRFISDKEILVGSIDGLYYCRINQSGEIEIFNQVKGIPKVKIPELIKMQNDSGFIVATEDNGIFNVLYNGKNFIVRRIDTNPLVDLKSVQSIYEDSKSNLWISTYSIGLIKLITTSSGQVSEAIYFNKSTGFATNYVKTVYEDRDGNIWSGNYGAGLTQLVEKLFSVYSFDEELFGSSIHSMFAYNNIVWIGTNKGLIKMNPLTNEILKFYSADYGLPNDAITAIYTNNENELWIGTKANGMFWMIVDKEEILPYKIGSGMLENSIISIVGKDDQLSVGTKKGVCKIDMTLSNVEWFTLEQGLPHNSINQLFIDSKGRVWISTLSNVISFIHNNKIEKMAIAPDNKLFALGPIAEDDESTIWVGSNGSGIFRIKSDSIANITSQGGLLSDYSYSLLSDNNNNIWVGHRGGLSIIRTKDLFIKPVKEYAGISNYCEFSRNAAFIDSKKRIWLGSNEGLWIFNPLLNDSVFLPPVLNILSIKINDIEVDYDKKIILPPDNYKLNIEFLGINLKEPNLVQYQYQLIGFDQSPVITKNRSISYPRLTDGKYTFILWATSGDGATSKTPLTLEIQIKTPLWKQWWFYIIISTILIFSIVIYIKRREKNYRKEKLILEKKVRARTKELTRKNTLLNEKQKQITEQNTELQIYRKHLEQIVDVRTKELHIAKNKAEESDRLKTAFLENMSHEIRTPMNGIIGFLSLLKENNLSNRNRIKYIEIITKSGGRLLTTINNIIEISKIESQQVTIKYSVVNLMETMEYYLNFFKHEADKKGLQLKLTTQLKENQSIIESDNKILDHILINLINNAIKFTLKGSVKFGNYLEENSLVFFVEDTGMGIPADRVEFIFNRFVQADLSNTRAYEGSGLGLSIVKGYVEMLKGKIWVESELGKGSSFYFSIPYKPAKKQSAKVSQRRKLKPISNKLKILIAEDDEDSYLFLKTILNDITESIIHATNGKEAINLIRENPDISLVLMDIKMPEINGFEAIRQIRKFNTTIPIIAQTAYATLDDKNKAIEAGCSDYISKPIVVDELFQLVYKYIQQA